MCDIYIEIENLCEFYGTKDINIISEMCLIAASISNKVSIISKVAMNKNILTLIKALKILGADIELDNENLRIDGRKTLEPKNRKEMYIKSAKTEGVEKGRIPLKISSSYEKNFYTIRPFEVQDNIVIDCGVYVSLTEILLPLSISRGNKIKFAGYADNQVNSLKIYYEIFKKQNIKYFYDSAPFLLEVNGRLKGSTFNLESHVSLRCILGLILASPLLSENSNISFKGSEFEAYIDLVVEIIKNMGFIIEENKKNTLFIAGNQKK